MTGKSGPCQRSPSTLAAGREWKCPRNLLAQSPVRSIQAQTLRDVTVLSNDSQEAPINQRHWRRGSVTHDGEADKSPMRVCGFLRHTPMSNQSGRRNAAPARISRQEPDTPLAHRRPEYPLAGGRLLPSRACLRFLRQSHFNPIQPRMQPLDIGVCLKQIHRRLRADRPFVSSERSRQPESPHSGVAHLAPEYWPTF